MTQSKRCAIAAGVAVAVVLPALVAYWSEAGRALAPNLNDPELVALGEQLYRDSCASCHGVELEGQPDWQQPLPDGGFPAPPHDADGHTWHHPDRRCSRSPNSAVRHWHPPDSRATCPRSGSS